MRKGVLLVAAAVAVGAGAYYFTRPKTAPVEGEEPAGESGDWIPDLADFWGEEPSAEGAGDGDWITDTYEDISDWLDDAWDHVTE
jgi:hypothetical protein